MDAEGLNTRHWVLILVTELLSEVHNQLDIVPNNLFGELVVLLYTHARDNLDQNLTLLLPSKTHSVRKTS